MTTNDIDAIRRELALHAQLVGPGGDKAWTARQVAAKVPALCDEVEQLRAELARVNTAFNDAVAEIRELYIERDALRTELAKARKDRDDYAEDNTRVAVALVDVQRKLADVASVKCWTNEDGKRFVFVTDLQTALGVPTDALPTANTDDQPCCGYRCQDNTTGVTS